MLNSKILLNSLRQALISNKDDTGEVVAQLGLFVEKVDSLTEKVDYYENKSIIENSIGWSFTGIGAIVGLSGIIIAGINDWEFNTLSTALTVGGFGATVVYPSVKIGGQFGLIFKF